MAFSYVYLNYSNDLESSYSENVTVDFSRYPKAGVVVSFDRNKKQRLSFNCDDIRELELPNCYAGGKHINRGSVNFRRIDYYVIKNRCKISSKNNQEFCRIYVSKVFFNDRQGNSRVLDISHRIPSLHKTSDYLALIYGPVMFSLLVAYLINELRLFYRKRLKK